MPEATLTTVTALLKEIYGPDIQNQLNDEMVEIKRLTRSSDGITTTVTGGKYVDFPIHTGRNPGIGYRLETEALPTASRQSYQEVHVGLAYGYGRGQITGQAMRLAETNRQSFASAMDREMNRLKIDIAKDSNRQVYGDGTGRLCTFASGDGVNTFVADNVQYLNIGDIVDIRNTTTGALLGSSGIEITNINTDTRVVTYSGADQTLTTAHGLYRAGNFAGATSREITGWGKIVAATGTLFDVNPSTVPVWKATVLGNNGVNRALSEGLMIFACDQVRVAGARVSVIFTSLGVRRAYFNLLTQQRRYTNTQEFAGGFKGLPFHYGSREIPVVESVDAPPNRMWGISEDELTIHQEADWSWLDDDGNVLKWVTGFDSFEYVLYKYWEMGTTRRNAHFQIQDITEG